MTREDDEDDALMRSLVRSEEDRRRLHPSVPWSGGYRWFKSPNVIPLEKFREPTRIIRPEPPYARPRR
jgi:hypothetical protein